MINNLIKKESFKVIISVIILSTLFIGVSYSAFFSVGEGNNNVISFGDIDLSFCADNECSTNSSLGQIIGTKIIDGNIINTPIYPYQNDIEAFSTDPYIFNLKNNGSLITTLTIKLIEDVSFVPSSNYNDYERLTINYASHLKVGIRDCTDGITMLDSSLDINGDGIINSSDISDGNATLVNNEIIKYNSIMSNINIINYQDIVDNKIVQNETLDVNQNKSYCLWMWLDNTTPNDVQKTYYKASIGVDYEYLPNN